jgi:hypothetical protein
MFMVVSIWVGAAQPGQAYSLFFFHVNGLKLGESGHTDVQSKFRLLEYWHGIKVHFMGYFIHSGSGAKTSLSSLASFIFLLSNI